MLWAVWQSSSLCLHRQRVGEQGCYTSCSEQPLVASSSLTPFYQELFIPPLSHTNMLRAQKLVTPHTLLRPSIPLCRLFHFIDSRVTFIVVSAK